MLRREIAATPAATVLRDPVSSATLDNGLLGVVRHGWAAKAAPTLNQIVSDLMA